MKLILPVVYSINGCGTGQSQTISHLQMHQIYQIHIPQPRFWHILATFLGLDHWSTMVLTHSYRIVTSSVPWGPGDVRIQIWSAIAWWHVPMMAHPRCSRRAFRMCPWRIQAVKSLKGSKGYLWWRDVTCRSNIFFGNMFVDGSGCHFGFACDMTKPLPWLRQCLKVHDFTRVPLHRANWCKLCKESKNVFGIVCVFPNDFQCDCVLMLWFCTTASSSSSSLGLQTPRGTKANESQTWGPGLWNLPRYSCWDFCQWYSPILMAWICLNPLFQLFSLGSQNCSFFSTCTLWSFKSLCFNSLSSRR